MGYFTEKWTAEKPLSLYDGTPLKNGADTPLACNLIAKPALIANVHNATKAGNNGYPDFKRADFPDLPSQEREKRLLVYVWLFKYARTYNWKYETAACIFIYVKSLEKKTALELMWPSCWEAWDTMDFSFVSIT